MLMSAWEKMPVLAEAANVHTDVTHVSADVMQH